MGSGADLLSPPELRFSHLCGRYLFERADPQLLSFLAISENPPLPGPTTKNAPPPAMGWGSPWPGHNLELIRQCPLESRAFYRRAPAHFHPSGEFGGAVVERILAGLT